jgi:dipeptidyl aminopeptidase/acylaminoacyl peptidase
MLHGVGSNRQDMLALGNFFVRQGCFVLEPDLRGHGESGGFTTYGVLEEGDMHAWLDWLEKSAHTEQIYGFGASLGGSVLLDSLRTESRFRAVVAESAYSDFPSIAEERIRRALPGGYRWIAGPLTASGIGWVRWHDGVDLRQASPADGLRSSSTPVLLIHGLADDRTSPDNSRRLAREARAASPDHGAETRLWLVPGSGHADAWKTSPAEFEARVNGWFSAH